MSVANRHYDEDYGPTQGSPPRKAPVTEMDATGIGLDVLGRSQHGRKTSFETRLAMQRELDTSRGLLKSQEAVGDDLRRQALQSREDAAIYRSENLRLQDELASCKARLNAALDAQDDVLKRNSEKHAQIHELQNKESSLREDLSSKSGLVDYYQQQNAALEQELQDVMSRAQATEKRLNEELSETLDALGQCRTELLARASENESVAAHCEALKAQIELKDAEVDTKSAELSNAAMERMEVRDELQASVVRLEAVQDTQNELRRTIAAKANELLAKNDEIDQLRATNAVTVSSKNNEIAQLRDTNAAQSAQIIQLQAQASEIAILQKTQEHLTEQLCTRDQEIVKLQMENTKLSAVADELEALQQDRTELATHLADQEMAAARFQAEANRLAMEKENLRQTGVEHERRLELELSSAKAKERALMDQTVSLHRYIGTRECQSRAADLAAARALRSYHGLRAEHYRTAREAELLARTRVYPPYAPCPPPCPCPPGCRPC